MENKTISSFVEDEYKSYSKYVLFHRAIPSMIDGFKMVQRKAWFLLKNQDKFQKTASVGANLISQAGYNHGDTSANSSVSLMAQDFVGGNNLPLFLGKGSFGNRFIPEPAAARYTYVKKNPVFDRVFLDYDLCPTNPDPEYPEPLYYLPIIPTVLLNGTKGIAVGFATDIPPHSPLKIIQGVRSVLDQKKQEELKPEWDGFRGRIEKDEDGKWVQYGVWERKTSTEIRITEVPTGYDREKYLTHLNKLLDKGWITSIDDYTKEQWDIIIRLPRKSKVWEDPVKHLKLSQRVSYNITVVDQDEELRVFQKPEDLLEEFVLFRLEKYEERRDKRIQELEEKIRFLTQKKQWLEEALNFDWKGKSKKDVKDHFLSSGFMNGDLDKFLSISIYKLNVDTVKEIEEDLDELRNTLEYYQKTTAKELYLIDLDELEKTLKKKR